MHRQSILKLLRNFQPLKQSDQPTTERFLEFVKNHEDCFERSQLSGHVTGSAWLVNTDCTHVLLTHHKKLGMWLQLGGHSDGNPDTQAVALREAKEESGIEIIEPVSDQLLEIDIHKIPARDHEPEHYHYDATFAFQSVNTNQFVVSEESHALEWVEISKLHEKTTEPSLMRMAEQWRRLEI